MGIGVGGGLGITKILKMFTIKQKMKFQQRTGSRAKRSEDSSVLMYWTHMKWMILKC